MESLTFSEWLLAELKQSRFPPRMPAHRRVYESIRRAIASHHLTPGTRLPSTRSLAEALAHYGRILADVIQATLSH